MLVFVGGIILAVMTSAREDGGAAPGALVAVQLGSNALIASASAAGTVQVWHAKTGERLATVNDHRGEDIALALTLDETEIATSSSLGLASVEEQLIEMKLALSAKLRKTRESGNLTQTALAKRMGSSQSRIAKMEAGDPSVSLDLLVQGLLAAGATRRQIAYALGQRKKAVGE